MEIILLGTGAALPPTDRDHTSLAISWDGGIWLVDCGSAPHRRLRLAGLDPGRLRGVLITHDHPDHLYGLPSLIHCLIAEPIRDSTLPILAPGEALQTAESILAAFRLSKSKDLPLRLVALREEDGSGAGTPAWEVDGLRLWTEPVQHSRQTVGVRAEVDGIAAAYSSDTGPCEGVMRLARGASMLVHEATYSEHDRAEVPRGHSTARDAGRAAAAAGVNTLVLVHFSERAIEDPAALVAQAQKEFDGTVLLGEDLGRYPV